MLFTDFNEFQTVAPGIFGVEPPFTGKVVIVHDGFAAIRKGFAKPVQVMHRESRMSFFRRSKIPLHPDVELLRAAQKPATAACPQYGRLFDFFHPENRAVEFSRRRFAALGRGDLDVIEARDVRNHSG